MTDDEAKDAILSAAAALPRPVSTDDISAIAAQILVGNRLFYFNKWLETQGAALCARLNAQ